MSETFQVPEEAPVVLQVVDVSDGAADPGEVITAIIDPTPDGTDDLVMVTTMDADGDGQADDVVVGVMNDTDGDGVLGSEGDEMVVMVAQEGAIDEGMETAEGDAFAAPGAAADGFGVSADPGLADAGLADPAFAAAGFAETPDIGFAGTAGAGFDPAGDGYGASAGADLGGYGTAGTAVDPGNETASAEAAQQAAHLETAEAAQAQADQYVEAGNYEAAAQAREEAEDHAWQAGDSTVLHGSESQELENAAWHQETAAEYQEQQADLAQAGDYEGAREAASNAAWEIGEADFQAGGSDHTAEAEAQATALDNADWYQNWAQEDAANAASYAAEGNLETAEIYAAGAEQHQEQADTFGAVGDPESPMAAYDASSEMDNSTYVATDDFVGYADGSSAAVADGSYSAYDSSSSSTYDSSYDTE